MDKMTFQEFLDQSEKDLEALIKRYLEHHETTMSMMKSGVFDDYPSMEKVKEEARSARDKAYDGLMHHASNLLVEYFIQREEERRKTSG